jgi:hypothetical protein
MWLPYEVHTLHTYTTNYKLLNKRGGGVCVYRDRYRKMVEETGRKTFDDEKERKRKGGKRTCTRPKAEAPKAFLSSTPHTSSFSLKHAIPSFM